MAFTIIAIGGLVALVVMTSVGMWKKALTHPILLISIPTVAFLVAVLSLVIRADSPLLVELTITMVFSALCLMFFSAWWIVADIIDQRRCSAWERENKASAGTER